MPATTSRGDSRPDARTAATARQDARHFLELLRTLADPIRLRIVRLLEANPQLHRHARVPPAGGLSVGELAEILKLPQSTVSRHLKTLTDAGLAALRRDGTSTYYSLAPASNRTVAAQLRLLARSQLEHDPDVRNDAHRLAAVRRKRTPAADSFFGQHAPQWDRIRAQWFGDTFHLEGLLALLNPAWTVADIGTGTGAMLPLLAPHVQRVIAVDPSAAMLQGARRRVQECALANVEIRQGSAERLPITGGAADVALLALVLAYVEEPASALREARRILQPGGILLLIDLQPHTVELFRDRLNHRHMGFSQEELTAWLMEAGFTAVRWHPLTPPKGRAKESATPIPDLFALRAEAADG